VILDEIHRLTELSARAFTPVLAGDTDENADVLTHFFAENLAEAVMGLTATVPDHKRDPEKYAIIQQVAPIVFRYTLDQAVEEGMIADYEIRVILHPLDNTAKTIDAGTKKMPFKTTEAKQYEFLESQIRKYQMLAKQNEKLKQMPFYKTMERNRFIYNLPSKTLLAEKILKKILADGKRTLVFCGSIDQTEKLLAPNTFHSKTNSTAYDLFNSKKISNLGVVNAANEGINFTDLDQALIVQLDSNPRNLVQRIGRCLRLRDNHKAIIYILVVQGTADERWLEKAITGFDTNKIHYYTSKGI
jgi:superfamily II DNA or RNA helicase